MQRTRRQENNNGLKVVGYVRDGGLVADVDDRFNTPIAVLIGEQRGWIERHTLAETGIYGLTVSDVVTLGFTTDEYKAMLRYAEASGPKDFIRNEYELTALMAGKVPNIVEELRLAYKDIGPGTFPINQLTSRSQSGKRTRGSDRENEIYALGWIDEKGERVRRVADRFKSRFAFVGMSGQQKISEPLAETGIRSFPLVSIVALGFSSSEYHAMRAYELETFEYVQSEEELDELVLSPNGTVRMELT